MSWLDTLLAQGKAAAQAAADAARERLEAGGRELQALLPDANPVQAARQALAETVADRMREAAMLKAYEMLARTHRTVLVTIAWQNAVLLASLVPVYLLHSGWPFYLAYAGVLGYSVFASSQWWPLVRQMLAHRSLTGTLAEHVQTAIETELARRQAYERKAIEWLGPDLSALSLQVARTLRPDILVAAANFLLTMSGAFVAFRLFVIPLLEQRALAG